METSPPDEPCHHWETPGNRAAHVPSTWDMPYPEHSSGWQGFRSDVHGPSLDIPGVLAVDLVGHDGGQAAGEFGWTLTVTDCTTGWTETGAVRTKAEVYVVAALESCLRRYPGKVVSLHSDNGSESTPGHLVRFCHARGITFTRSRPYHKNDNAHVEEKNNSVVRKFVRYDRHDGQAEVDLLNRTYRFLHLLVNWFLPSQKLLHKVRSGSHITKVYDRAQTLCARMLARMDVSEETVAINMCSAGPDEPAPRDPPLSGATERDCKEETTSGHQETWQLRVLFR